MIYPVFRVVTTQYPIASTTKIEAGQAVTLDSNGKAIKAYNTAVPIGLSADRSRAAEAYEWVNRISDFGNESRASRLLSVYHGGGEFYVDLDDNSITTPNGTAIRGVVTGSSPAVAAKLYCSGSDTNADTAGMLTTTAGSATIAVATVVEVVGALDSGIPGEYLPGSSIDYVTDYDTQTGSGARKFVKIKLEV